MYWFWNLLVWPEKGDEGDQRVSFIELAISYELATGSKLKGSRNRSAISTANLKGKSSGLRGDFSLNERANMMNQGLRKIGEMHGEKITPYRLDGGKGVRNFYKLGGPREVGGFKARPEFPYRKEVERVLLEMTQCPEGAKPNSVIPRYRKLEPIKPIFDDPTTDQIGQAPKGPRSKVPGRDIIEILDGMPADLGTRDEYERGEIVRARKEDESKSKPPRTADGYNLARMEAVLVHRRGYETEGRHKLTRLKLSSKAKENQICIECELCKDKAAAEGLTYPRGLLASKCLVACGEQPQDLRCKRRLLPAATLFLKKK